MGRVEVQNKASVGVDFQIFRASSVVNNIHLLTTFMQNGLPILNANTFMTPRTRPNQDSILKPARTTRALWRNGVRHEIQKPPVHPKSHSQLRCFNQAKRGSRLPPVSSFTYSSPSTPSSSFFVLRLRPPRYVLYLSLSLSLLPLDVLYNYLGSLCVSPRVSLQKKQRPVQS